MHTRAVASLLFCAAACHSRTYQVAGGEVDDPSAQVVLRSSSGERLGELRIERGPNGLARLRGSLDGIPAGRYGIHLHSVGRCDAPTFESAGPHFNPGNKRHGLENPAGPHAGDAPNLEAQASRRTNVDLTFARATLADTEFGLWDGDGTAVVIHAGPDDQRTDPSGNSGERIACGVVNHAR